MKILIPGRAVPYKRTTQKQKFVDKSYQKYRDYKDSVRIHAMKHKIKPILEGNVMVYINVFLKGKSTPMGNDGDLDNYIKGVLDSLNGIAYKDDRQVVQVLATKQPSKEEYVEVYIFKDTYDMRIKYNTVIIKSLCTENENLYVKREIERQKLEGQVSLFEEV